MQEAWDMGSAPELGRSPAGGRGNPLQSSCLENPMDTGAWTATAQTVVEPDTAALTWHAHTHAPPSFPELVPLPPLETPLRSSISACGSIFLRILWLSAPSRASPFCWPGIWGRPSGGPAWALTDPISACSRPFKRRKPPDISPWFGVPSSCLWSLQVPPLLGSLPGLLESSGMPSPLDSSMEVLLESEGGGQVRGMRGMNFCCCEDYMKWL